MRLLGVPAIYQRPNTSKPTAAHKIYPYLLGGLTIERVNQVWCSDVTYIPMAKGFVYLVVRGRAGRSLCHGQQRQMRRDVC
jgi:putative transposase